MAGGGGWPDLNEQAILLPLASWLHSELLKALEYRKQCDQQLGNAEAPSSDELFSVPYSEKTHRSLWSDILKTLLLECVRAGLSPSLYPAHQIEMFCLSLSAHPDTHKVAFSVRQEHTAT